MTLVAHTCPEDDSVPAYYDFTDEVVATYGPTCHLCAGPIDLTIRNGGAALQLDHVWPQSYGGCHHVANLRPSHRTCNASRGNRILLNARRPICPCARRPVTERSRQPGPPKAKRTRLFSVGRIVYAVACWWAIAGVVELAGGSGAAVTFLVGLAMTALVASSARTARAIRAQDAAAATARGNASRAGDFAEQPTLRTSTTVIAQEPGPPKTKRVRLFSAGRIVYAVTCWWAIAGVVELAGARGAAVTSTFLVGLVMTALVASSARAARNIRTQDAAVTPKGNASGT
ncbi:hypothetical protein ACVW07_001474 [Cellulomonas sp. URHB0016]